jgi:hypothetical protein
MVKYVKTMAQYTLRHQNRKKRKFLKHDQCRYVQANQHPSQCNAFDERGFKNNLEIFERTKDFNDKLGERGVTEK